MSEKFIDNKPEASKAIARAWLYELLKEIELCGNVDGERTVLTGNKRTLTFTFTGSV